MEAIQDGRDRGAERYIATHHGNQGRQMTEGQIEEYEERAAIIEYFGLVPRAEAERLARLIVEANLPLVGPN